jgi:membrane fusion protein, multidrug efflux system
MDDFTPPALRREADAGNVARRHRKLIYLPIVAVVIMAIVAIVLWRLFSLEGQAKQPRGRFSGPAQPVGVTTVEQHDIHVVLDELGTVTPLETITVQTQLSGLLMSLGFQEGQTVQKGQLLAQIDPRPYEVALEQYQGQLLRDQGALKQAQMDLERYQSLLAHDAIAKQTVDDQVWLVHQDEGTVKLDQAQVAAQKLNLTYCHITSPVTGRVGIRLVDPGNYIQTGSTTGIVVVTQLDPISVLFNVPEDSVQNVLEKLHEGTSLQVAAYDRANEKQLATGTLAAVDTQIDTTTGTVKMRAVFDNASGVLFPDEFVNVRLLLDTIHNAVAVPQPAVQNGSAGTFVYLLAADNIVNVHPVQLGPQDGELIAIEGGLAAGDRVVTDGTDQLRDNAHVVVRAERADSSAPGAAPAAQSARQHAHQGQRHRAGSSPAPQGHGQNQDPGEGGAP